MKKENVDKIVRTINDIPEVWDDVLEAKKEDSAGGSKVTFFEGSSIAIKHGGKALRFISDIEEIGDEIFDLEGEETPEITEAVFSQYSPENPHVKEGVEKTLKGAAFTKEGLIKLSEAKKWEKENK